MNKPMSPPQTCGNLASEKLYLAEAGKAFLCVPSAPQAPSWPTSRSGSTSMSEKPAEWCGMLPLPLTSCTPKVNQAFALAGGLGWPASGDQRGGAVQAEGWARGWCCRQAHPWGREGSQASDVDVGRGGAIKKDKDIEERKEQGGKTINFMLYKVMCECVNMNDFFS